MKSADQMLRVLTSGTVTRFHAKQTVFRRTVAEHSWQVGVLLAYLTSSADDGWMLLHGLTHDCGELDTCDMPSPVKRQLPPDLRAHWEALERKKLVELGCPDGSGLTAEGANLLNIADGLSGMWTCLEESRLGNRTLEGAFRAYQGYVADAIDFAELAPGRRARALHSLLVTEFEK